MENYIFIKSQSGDRTNILSNFQVMDREKFIEMITKQEPKNWREDYRYSRINGCADNIKGMSLKEFEEVFSDCLEQFTPELVTRVFRKEISEVYGEHKLRKEKKVLSSKDLVRGGVYLDAKGEKHLYLGNVEKTEKHVIFRYGKKDDSVETGKGWINLGGGELDYYKDKLDYMIKSYMSVLKSNRKVVELIEVWGLPEEGIKLSRSGQWRRRENLDDRFEITINLV